MDNRDWPDAVNHQIAIARAEARGQKERDFEHTISIPRIFEETMKKPEIVNLTEAEVRAAWLDGEAEIRRTFRAFAFMDLPALTPEQRAPWIEAEKHRRKVERGIKITRYVILGAGLLAGIVAATLLYGAEPYRTKPYDFRALALAERPYADEATDYYAGLEHDAAGNPVVRVGGTAVVHPQVIAHSILCSMDFYRRMENPVYLSRAERLAATAGGPWFPYPFDFPLHGSKAPADLMHAPWYSGMAQGQMLSAFSRLSEITRKPGYRRAADAIFKTYFAQPPGPWFAATDPDGYLWLEEYPQDPARLNRTLNGMIFSIFGLYDYWVLSGNARALDLMRAATWTVEAHLADYRQPGGPSLYCLGHRKADARYHQIVCGQLLDLARLSGEDAFRQAAGIWATDRKEKKP